MSEPHEVINEASPEQARLLLARCCASARWVDAMLMRRPFASTSALHASASQAWSELGAEDWLEAFRRHPRIGEAPRAADGLDGEGRPDPEAAWSRSEQAGVRAADAATAQALREGNREYETRFGYVFLVCATGKSAAEMLAALRARLANDPARELPIAAAELAKILHLRLDKLAP